MPLTDETSDENVAKKSIKKMDTIVTGLILSGVIASIYGVKKIHDKKKGEMDTLAEEKNHIHEDHPPVKKRSIVSRIFFGN